MVKVVIFRWIIIAIGDEVAMLHHINLTLSDLPDLCRYYVIQKSYDTSESTAVLKQKWDWLEPALLIHTNAFCLQDSIIRCNTTEKCPKQNIFLLFIL